MLQAPEGVATSSASVFDRESFTKSRISAWFGTRTKTFARPVSNASKAAFRRSQLSSKLIVGSTITRPPDARRLSRGCLEASLRGAMEMLETRRTIALDGTRVRDLRLRTGLSREALSDKSCGVDALSVATI